MARPPGRPGRGSSLLRTKPLFTSRGPCLSAWDPRTGSGQKADAQAGTSIGTAGSSSQAAAAASSPQPGPFAQRRQIKPRENAACGEHREGLWVCVSVRVCLCMGLCVSTCVCVLHECVCAPVSLCVYLCLCFVCLCWCLCMYVCMYVCLCVSHKCLCICGCVGGG